MKNKNQLANHEIWHVCVNCQEEFDRKKHIDSCPKCGHLVDKIVDSSKK